MFVFFFLLNLRVTWQTCATVNVRYFPWGKLGWEGPGTLLAKGLPEIKGCGTGGQRGIVHRSHCHYPSRATLHPFHWNPLCGSVHTLIYSTQQTRMHQVCRMVESATPWTRLTMPDYKWNMSGWLAFSWHSHKSRHLKLKHKQCCPEIFGHWEMFSWFGSVLMHTGEDTMTIRLKC